MALVLAALSAGAPWSARPAAATAGLDACLHRLLPPGIDVARLGARAQASKPVGLAECLRLAGVMDAAPGWDWVPAQVSEDFATGRIVTVDGWQLSQTEAWLCAALHASG